MPAKEAMVTWSKVEKVCQGGEMAAEQVHRCPRTTKDHRGLQSNNAFKANWAARTYRGYVGKITSHYHRHHHDCFNHPCYHHHLRNHHQGQLSTSRTPKGYVGCRKNMFSDFGTNTFVGFCLLARARGLFKNMPIETLAPL